MFTELQNINRRPAPFECYTAADLWTDEHTSKQMLSYHLNGEIDVSSRKSTFIDKSVSWMASKFGIGTVTRLLDLGCGPGLYSTKLSELGAKITGIDFSKRSIEYARKVASDKNLQIEYLNQDYLDYQTEHTFDIAMMIMCDFCALSPIQRQKILENLYESLVEDGVFLFDVYSLNAFKKRSEGLTYEKNLLHGFWSPEDYYGFLNTFKYEQEKVVLDKYTIIEQNRNRTVYNWLQYFSLTKLEAELDAAGFKIISTYSDVAGTPFQDLTDEFSVVVQKK